MNVQRGAEVTAGQPLFTLEHESETAALARARSLLREAEARLADLQKGLRPSEFAALEASIREARTKLALATLQLERRRKLAGTDGRSITREELDRMASKVAEAKANVRFSTAALRQECRTPRRTPGIRHGLGFSPETTYSAI